MSDVRREAAIRQHGCLAGHLAESHDGTWAFTYAKGYAGPPVSLTLPVRSEGYVFQGFPAVFEGLLPEGPQLEALLRKHKIDRADAFRQLVTVGADLVGSLTVSEEPSGPPLESSKT
ncbi:MAG: HipA N-terminal domain-containing protein [Verrucomicrobia bacterium]|nr:HipA N-terminal domain-containing protein [Verrucomicrobiota bacterium]